MTERLAKIKSIIHQVDPKLGQHFDGNKFSLTPRARNRFYSIRVQVGVLPFNPGVSDPLRAPNFGLLHEPRERLQRVSRLSLRRFNFKICRGHKIKKLQRYNNIFAKHPNQTMERKRFGNGNCRGLRH